MDEISLHRKLADALEDNRQLLSALQAEGPKSSGSSWFFWVALTLGLAGLAALLFAQGDLPI